MDNFSNIILTVMFGGIAVWLGYGAYRTRNLVFRDKLWSVSRILFLAAGILCVLTAFVFSSLLDWIRLLMMTLCVIGFLMLRDGIGEEGIAVMGRMTKYSDIRAYDYGDYKKQFRVYFSTGESADSPNYVALDPNQKTEIIAYLKEKMGKKYTRMKKG